MAGSATANDSSTHGERHIAFINVINVGIFIRVGLGTVRKDASIVRLGVCCELVIRLWVLLLLLVTIVLEKAGRFWLLTKSVLLALLLE